MSSNKDIVAIRKVLHGGISTGGITLLKKVTGAELGADGAAYGAADVIGDKAPIEITNVFRDRLDGKTAILQSVIVQDLSAQSLDLDILIFDANPSASTFTDNAAVDVADADLPKLIGGVSIVAADYIALADSSVATKTNISLTVSSIHTSLWIVCVTRGTPTYVADELSLVLGFLQD